MDINNQLKTLPTLEVKPSAVASSVDNQTVKQTVQQEKVTEAEVLKVKEAKIERQLQSPAEQTLETAVNELNLHVQNVQRSLQFTIDEESGRDVVTVLDKDTEEVIRQLPSEEALAIARQLAQQKQEQQDDFIQLFSSTA